MNKVTLQQIADRVGVSKALVSKALANDPAVNDGTRERIWQTAQDMGYRFDKLRKTPVYSRTGNVAVLMPELYLEDSEYWGKIIRGIDNELKNRDFSMMLSGIPIGLDPQEGLPSSIQEAKVDGALLLGHMPESYKQALEERKLPFVLVDSDDQTGSHDHVLANNYLGGLLAGKRLLAARHHKLAYIGDVETAWSFRERYRGLEAAAADERAEKADPEIGVLQIRGMGVSGTGNYVQPSFSYNLRKAVMEERVTGFFCGNDRLAVETLRILAEWGFTCPRDYSLIGFDDLSIAGLMIPQLTTIQAPKEQMGAKAARCMLERIATPDKLAEHVELATELINRESVRAT